MIVTVGLCAVAHFSECFLPGELFGFIPTQ
jgi:hypothetical protein